MKLAGILTMIGVIGAAGAAEGDIRLAVPFLVVAGAGVLIGRYA